MEVCFEPLIQVPGAGTTKQEQTYTTLDEQPLSGVSYYRLKQTDFDGAYSYKGVIEVYIDDSLNVKAHLAAFPNPASTQLTLSIHLNDSLPAELRLFSINGQQVLFERVNLNQGSNTHQLDVSSLTPGMYFAQVKPVGNYPDLGKVRIVVQR